MTLKPAAATADGLGGDGGDDGGGGAGLFIGLGALAVLGAVGLIWARSRRRSADERE